MGDLICFGVRASMCVRPRRGGRACTLLRLRGYNPPGDLVHLVCFARLGTFGAEMRFAPVRARPSRTGAPGRRACPRQSVRCARPGAGGARIGVARGARKEAGRMEASGERGGWTYRGQSR